MALRATSRMPGSRAGFTLVELMIVVVIMVLLAALLLPALNGAVRYAARAADESLIQQIAMGLETYNQVFFDYVPSGWDAPGTPSVSLVAGGNQSVWPPTEALITVNTPMLTGSAKLFAAMAGFNAVYCWDAADPAAWNMANWLQPCGEITYRGITVDANHYDGAYSEDKVYGPYYAPNEKGQTRVRINWNNDQADQMVFASRFERPNRSTPAAGRETGAPILYYRAERHPDGNLDGNGVVNPWEIYFWRNNWPITHPRESAAGTWTSAEWGAPIDYDPPANWREHPMFVTSDGIRWNGSVADVDGDGKPDRFGIVRPGTYSGGGAGQVFNADTFILISPGPDGEYFTADDVKNF